jgi:predicted metallo-beta-lactamase superfamily hydrolase
MIEKSDEKIVFAPDVQGPISKETVKVILDEKPSLVILGGPPTYLRGFRIGEEFFRTALIHMERIAKEVETLVIDHHLLRDDGWYKFLEPVRKSAESMGHRVITAAELARKEPNPLECRRKELYEEEKPTAEFLKWAKLPKEKLSETAPPL